MKPISLLNVPICTQDMQRTRWPEAGTIIVTGPYCLLGRDSISRAIATSPMPLDTIDDMSMLV